MTKYIFKKKYRRHTIHKFFNLVCGKFSVFAKFTTKKFPTSSFLNRFAYQYCANFRTPYIDI